MADYVDDLGFELETALAWFTPVVEEPYVLVKVAAEHVAAWSEVLGVAVRRCYLSDELILVRAGDLGAEPKDIIAAALPDPGSTMSGDFGEILVFFYQASRELPHAVFGPRKWRLKQDRTKPAPHSDVVQFVFPHWPTPSEEDALLCSEVKTKATDGTSKPIEEAIEDSKKDKISRLAKTLVWLREKALLQDVDGVDVAMLERFIRATDHPPASRRFRAVAVISSNLVNQQLEDAPTEAHDDYTVVVISVPELKATYESVFKAARQAVPAVAEET
ncbi:MAG: Hachiman antiphage defense system protein HamA [Thiohalocapsa sp.]|jgi:hypothetical protein